MFFSSGRFPFVPGTKYHLKTIVFAKNYLEVHIAVGMIIFFREMNQTSKLGGTFGCVDSSSEFTVF